MKFSFRNNKTQSGHIKFKIMILKQMMHHHKILTTFKLISKLINAEIFLDFKFKNQI